MTRPGFQKHHGEWIGALSSALLAVGVSGCALPPTEGPRSLDEIGAQLVEAAEIRSSLRSMRVWLYEIHETRPEPASAQFGVGRHHGDDAIGTALAHELVITLCARLNLVEAEVLPPPAAQVSNASLGDLAAAYGATHLLAGDYLRKGDALLVSVRLIETDSRLIVAAARGVVPLAELGDLFPVVDDYVALSGRYREGH